MPSSRLLACLLGGLCLAGSPGVFCADSSPANPAETMPATTLSSAHFRVLIDPVNGSLAELVHPADPAGMSWISSARNAPWQPRSLQWGLGYANVGATSLHRGRWETPEKITREGHTARILYRAGALQIEVTRTLADDAFTERYTFTNTGTTPLPLTHWSEGAFALYAPFNDNYTTAADCLENRAHAHLWCGQTTAWVCALRMGGRGPHLGWVLTEGAISAYSIDGRNQTTSSNTRGLFLLHPAFAELPPGETRAVAWTFFWHEGWDDFFAQCARRSPQFVRLEAARYTAHVGEEIALTLRGASLRKPKLTANGKNLRLKQVNDTWQATVKAEAVGEITCQLTSESGTQTSLRLNVTPALPDLIAARTRFIVERQQVRQAGDPLDHAFLVYDNERDAIVRKDWGHDRNEARERIGMGVLLARWLRSQTNKDAKVHAALGKYYTFVSTRLQRDDGAVFNAVGDEHARLYNWPWVMQLHLEMARLTQLPLPLNRFVKTVENYYASGGEKFYPIGIPVFEGLATLKAARRTADHDRVLALFLKHGERMAATGLHYPPHEVNFEQSIVGPAAIFLLELHRATGDARWLEAAKPHLRCLELFGGRQPDHRLHEVAIRHWDGYWFGKARLWGDTFPHYWSTLTAVAFHHYAAITGETPYAARADEIIRNNLSLFSADGRASCAYIYPLTVNGQPARLADPYANDQDWALVHALQIQE
jgi:hypothetical protein